MTKLPTRFYFHFVRYRLIFYLAIIIMTAAAFMFQSVYPGEEGIKTYIRIINFIIGTIGVENPTYLLWVLITTAVFLEYYIPVFSIGFGGFLLPFNERDGKELILTQKHSVYRYYLENVVVVCILIFVSMLPSYLIIIFDLVRNNASDSIPNINTIFILTFFTATFFSLLSGLGGILFFSRSKAYLTGALYFAFSLVVGIIGNVVDIGFIADFSLISRVDIIQNGLKNKIPEDILFEILLLLLLIILISLVSIRKINFIKNQTGGVVPVQSQKTKFKFDFRTVIEKVPFIKHVIGILCIVSVIFLILFLFLCYFIFPTYDVNLKIIPLSIYVCLILLFFIYEPLKIVIKKIKNPILADQLNALHWIFSLSVLAITFIFIYLFVIYPGDKAIGSYMNSFQSPIMTGPMFNHSVLSSIDGFLAVEIFAFTWLYYGPILLISINSIALRDYNNSYSEITFCLTKSENSIFGWRILGGIIFQLLLIVLNLVGLILVEFAFNFNSSMMNLFTTFIVVAFSYISYLLFFVALVFFFQNKNGQKVLILSFSYSIATIILAFTVKDGEWLRFLSPFGYFDYVGVFYNSLSVYTIVMQGCLFMIFAVISSFLIIKYHVPTKDLV